MAGVKNALVYLFRQSKTAAAIAAMLTLFAWLVASNHCALGLMRRPADAVQVTCHPNDGGEAGHCPLSDDPGKKPGPPMTCCKEVTKATLDAGTTVKVESSLVDVLSWLISVIAFPDNTFMELVPCYLDIGPPACVSFAEAVLQRSLLAHAPPLLS